MQNLSALRQMHRMNVHQTPIWHPLAFSWLASSDLDLLYQYRVYWTCVPFSLPTNFNRFPRLLDTSVVGDSGFFIANQTKIKQIPLFSVNLCA